ncbi:MAG: hypothetical protein ABH872_02100 [Candidatus Omnitrophota bacterium]
MIRQINPKYKRAFFTIIGMVFTLIILSYLTYLLVNTYLKPPSLSEGQGSLSGQNINASSYRSIANETKNKVEEIQKEHWSEIEKQLDGNW